MVITDRETFYQSAVYETPLTGDGSIDAVLVAQIVIDEYGKAQIERAGVESGAVIVTGETARLRNAEQVLHELSDLAGNFVVASAGPNLESILSARGSGACLESKRTGKTICNLDVGGGTINAAICRDGDVVSSACLGLGGRLVRLSESGAVRGWTEAGRRYAGEIGVVCQEGKILEAHHRRCLTDMLAEDVLKWLQDERAPKNERLRDFLVSQDANGFPGHAIDELWFSGGVACVMRNLQEGLQIAPLRYGDAGVYLARSLLQVLLSRGISFKIPAEAIRATVLGAAMHSLQLSGSTVTVSEKHLPIKNIPVVKISPSLKRSISQELRLRDIDWSSTCAAVAIETEAIDYQTLKGWAKIVSAAFLDLGGKEPLIVATAADIGLAFGQILRSMLGDKTVIVVDALNLDDGDYIDIGKPCTSATDLAGALPVVVKTLVFK